VQPNTDIKTDEWPLIPRKRLLGNPSRMTPKLSPDGRRLAWQAPAPESGESLLP
jgi:hypothetical protein